MRPFSKIVVFGVGLIGGSFSLAVRRAGLCDKIVGVGRNRENLELARQMGVVDEIGSFDSVAGADLVLIATPVAQIGLILQAIKPYLGEAAVVTDAGSTKGDVVAAAKAALGDRIGCFVPGHPIAGAEQSGVAAANIDLYRGKKVVLTPLAENSQQAVQLVREAWLACGAQVGQMSPELHDEVFAAVSHLPHLLSFALVHDLASRDNRELLLDFAASGFRDFTRIAASSPEMWRDIALSNRDALLSELDRYMLELANLRRALAARDSAAIEEIFSQAAKVRRAWAPK